MRTPLVAGNWKMNKTVAEARELVSKMKEPLREIKSVEKVLCPPSVALSALSEMLAGTDIGLGAQNMYWEEKGAFTGELAPNMVKEFCSYVIIGHSERRAYFGETDESVNRKLHAAVKGGSHAHRLCGRDPGSIRIRADGRSCSPSDQSWPGWHRSRRRTAHRGCL